MIQTCEPSFSSYPICMKRAQEYITQNGNMLKQHEAE